MTKEFLERCLAEGLSLDGIARRAGKHPSTVSYHLKKHGLTPNGQAVHAPNARVDADRLRELIERGATLREAASEFGVGYSTIRHWAKRLGLETQRMVRLREAGVAIEAGLAHVEMNCSRHGKVTFFKRPDGGFRCSRCRVEDVSRWRRKVKRRLIERAGGACQLCGYDRHPSALHFHHVDPSTKSFLISRNGATRSFAEAVAEADKCVLLCGNCHAEVEVGVLDLPAELSVDGKVGPRSGPHR